MRTSLLYFCISSMTFTCNPENPDGFNLDPRGKTYIHPSWLSKALAGDRQCLASLYLQANYRIPKGESDFDAEGYRLKHQTALTRYARQLREQDYTVHVENSNSFWYETKAGAEISAKPDLVAFRGDEVIVPDIKTGKELRASDIAQVKLYMSLIPAVRLHGVSKTPIGQLVHNDQVFEIAPHQVTTEFKQQVGDLVNLLCSKEMPPVTPSAQECRFCPLRHRCPHKGDAMTKGADDWL
jgi:CRISPR/Cas system-associated exonuclease Cas4 (RecB family)